MRIEIHGRLDVDQFWPTGSSDADTLHVHVEHVRVHPKPGAAWKKASLTHLRAPATGRRLMSNGSITVRLEGVDAPELHYTPIGAHGKPFRQRSPSTRRRRSAHT